MRFRFLAVDADGKSIKGEIIAESKSIATKELKQSGLDVQILQFCTSSRKKPKSLLEKFFKFFSGSKKKQSNWKHSFFEQLSMLLTAGLSVEQCLSSLAGINNNSKPNFDPIEILKEKISAGMSLSEAMMCCESTFSETEIKTIRAAEKIGQPAIALHELSEFGKKMFSIRRKIKSALTYPIIVLTVSSLALMLLMTVVIPKFETIFLTQSKGNGMPWLTQKVIGFCNFFSRNFISIFIFVVISVFLLKALSRTKLCRSKITSFSNKIPIFGRLLLDINLNNFFRTMGMLMSFGVPFQHALELAINVTNNKTLKESFEKLHKKIAQGKFLSDSFRENKLLSATDYGLIAAGEQSGTLPKSFLKIANTYDEKIETRLAFLTTLIEPIIIVFLAIVVGTIVIAMFLPMISLMRDISI